MLWVLVRKVYHKLTANYQVLSKFTWTWGDLKRQANQPSLNIFQDLTYVEKYNRDMTLLNNVIYLPEVKIGICVIKEEFILTKIPCCL